MKLDPTERALTGVCLLGFLFGVGAVLTNGVHYIFYLI